MRLITNHASDTLNRHCQVSTTIRNSRRDFLVPKLIEAASDTVV